MAVDPHAMQHFLNPDLFWSTLRRGLTVFQERQAVVLHPLHSLTNTQISWIQRADVRHETSIELQLLLSVQSIWSGKELRRQMWYHLVVFLAWDGVWPQARRSTRILSKVLPQIYVPPPPTCSRAMGPSEPMVQAGWDKVFPAFPPFFGDISSVSGRGSNLFPPPLQLRTEATQGSVYVHNAKCFGRGSACDSHLSPKSDPHSTLHCTTVPMSKKKIKKKNIYIVCVCMCVWCTHRRVVFSQLTHVRICLSLALCSNVTLPEFITSHLLIN